MKLSTSNGTNALTIVFVAASWPLPLCPVRRSPNRSITRIKSK